MAAAGLQGLTRRKGWRRAKPDTVASADDLVARSFRPDRPDELWVADITQHPTREGWVYCAVVIDAYSRLVVGHAIADHLRTELVIDVRLLHPARHRVLRHPEITSDLRLRQTGRTRDRDHVTLELRREILRHSDILPVSTRSH